MYENESVSRKPSACIYGVNLGIVMHYTATALRNYGSFLQLLSITNVVHATDISSCLKP